MEKHSLIIITLKQFPDFTYFAHRQCAGKYALQRHSKEI
jgi:hypothetical protein